MAQTQLTLIQGNLFDYAVLDRETEVAARSDAALIKGLMRRTAEDVIEIGSALIRQKDRLPHGMFLLWIETEFEMSEPTALRMMRVARTFGGKTVTVTGLGTTALYELAAPSTPPEVQAEVERRIAAGDLVTAAEVRSLREQHVEAAAKARELDMVKEQNRDLLANARRDANVEAEQRHGAEIAELKTRVASFEVAALTPATNNVVRFEPKQDAVESDEDDDSSVDLDDLRVGANVVYASISNIDLAKTTPEIFWSIFGTPNGKPAAQKWLKSALKTLNAIKKGMPK